jgi:hypothetical protein
MLEVAATFCKRRQLICILRDEEQSWFQRTAHYIQSTLGTPSQKRMATHCPSALRLVFFGGQVELLPLYVMYDSAAQPVLRAIHIVALHTP